MARLTHKKRPWIYIVSLLGILSLIGLLYALYALNSPREFTFVTKINPDRLFEQAYVYYNLGEGYGEDDKVQAEEISKLGNKVSFTITDEIMQQCKTFRFDCNLSEIVEKTDNCQLSISKVYINYGFSSSRKIEGKELSECIEDTHHMELFDEKNNTYVMTGDDPFILFTQSLMQQLIEQDTYLIRTNQMIALVCGILFSACLAIVVVCIGTREITSRFNVEGVAKAYEHISKYINRGKRRKDILAIYAIILLSVFLYRKYLWNEYSFLFVNMAGDSYHQTYPMLMNWAYRIANGINQAGWDFFNGFGTPISQIDFSLNSWVSFFGMQNVAYLLGISQILKVILSGICFYCFLRISKKSCSTCFLFATSYAFCGHMIGRQMWTYYPNEVLLIAIWLLCFELFFSKKDWRWLPIATLLFVLNSAPYNILFYFLFFTGYAVFRYCVDRKYKFVGLVKFLGRYFLLTWVIVLLINGSNIIGGLLNEIGSERFQNVLGDFKGEINEEVDGQNIEEQKIEELHVEIEEGKSSIFVDYDCARTVFYRLLDPNILGIDTDKYSGYNVYLADPVFYCGLLTILIIPLGFSAIEKKRKNWYMMLLLLATAYIFIVPFRVMCNGFSNDNFKQSSFWVSVLLILIAADAFENVIIAEKKKNIFGLSFCIIGIGMLQIYYSVTSDLYYDKNSFIGVLLLVGLYTLILRYIKNKNKEVFIVLLIAIKIIEVIVINQDAIVYRSSLRTATVVGDYQYEGYNQDAINYIQMIEGGKTDYRVDNGNAIAYNDSIVQRYLGTSIYLGGTATEIEKIREFYSQLGLPRLGNSGRLARLYLSDEINTLCGVKYLLTGNSSTSNFGYKHIASVGNVNIYENEYVLPLVYIYDEVITEKEFEKYSVTERRNVLLDAGVVENENSISDIYKIKANKDYLPFQMENYKIEYESSAENIYNIEAQDTDKVILVKADIIKEKEDNTLAYLYVADNMTNVEERTNCDRIHIQIDVGLNEYLYPVNYKDVSQFYFTIGEAAIQNVEFYAMPKDIYYEYYVDSLTELNNRQKSNVAIDEGTSSLIGNVQCNESGILYFSIPYNDNWHIYVDGQEQEKFLVNYAFMGTEIEQGNHEIALCYIAENVSESIGWYITRIIGYVLMVANFVLGCYVVKRKKIYKVRN